MKQLQNSFLVPVQQNVTKNKLNYSRSCGDVIVTIDSDEEIISLIYAGVELLPLFQQIEQVTGDGLGYFYSALDNFLASRREEEAVSEENEAIENY